MTGAQRRRRSSFLDDAKKQVITSQTTRTHKRRASRSKKMMFLRALAPLIVCCKKASFRVRTKTPDFFLEMKDIYTMLHLLLIELFSFYGFSQNDFSLLPLKKKTILRDNLISDH